jgi:hypothetical protein
MSLTISQRQIDKRLVHFLAQRMFLKQYKYAGLTMYKMCKRFEQHGEEQLQNFKTRFPNQCTLSLWCGDSLYNQHNKESFEETIEGILQHQSQAYKIIDAVYHNIPYSINHQQIVSQAKDIAIQDKADWDENDVIKLQSKLDYKGNFSSSAARYCFNEGEYTEMVYYRNLSACQAYEKFAGRQPVSFPCYVSKYIQRASQMGWENKKQNKQIKQQRLCEGAWFEWDEQLVRVTSFKGHEHLIACAYQNISAGREKIQKRYTLSFKELREKSRQIKQQTGDKSHESN